MAASSPTAETIGDGSYPFSRSLYIYVNTGKAAENPALASFVELYLSDEGLARVGDAGYVDLPADRIQASQGRLGRDVTTGPYSVGRPPSPRAGRRSTSTPTSPRTARLDTASRGMTAT